MASAEPKKRRGCLPVIALLVVVLVVSLGGWVLGAATRQAPVSVRPGVVVPLSMGWVLKDRLPDAGAELSGVWLTDGTASLLALSRETPDAESLLGVYRPLLERRVGSAQVSRAEPVTLASGAKGVRVGYAGTLAHEGTAVSGEIVVALWPGSIGVVFDGWAEETSWTWVRDDVRSMIDRTRVSA